jgi:hypothetical protein
MTARLDETLKLLREIRASQHSMQATLDAHTRALTKLTQGQRSLNLKFESVIAHSVAEDVVETSGLREQIRSA